MSRSRSTAALQAASGGWLSSGSSLGGVHQAASQSAAWVRSAERISGVVKGAKCANSSAE